MGPQEFGAARSRRVYKEVARLPRASDTTIADEQQGITLDAVSAALPDLSGVGVFEPTAAGPTELVLRCALEGETGGALEGGRWLVEVAVPPEYPFAPPTLHVVTPAFHPDLPPPPDTEYAPRDVAALRARIVAARQARNPPHAAGPAQLAARVAALPPPTTALGVRTHDDQVTRLPLAQSDTVAELKLRYSLRKGAPPADAMLVIREGRQLSDVEALFPESANAASDAAILHVLPRLYAAPCGPFTILEGGCSVCRDRQRPHHPGFTIFEYLQDARRALHGHRLLHELTAAEAQHGRWDVQWSPWCAVWDTPKVRNMLAGALMAEGRAQEYERLLAEATARFASGT